MTKEKKWIPVPQTKERQEIIQRLQKETNLSEAVLHILINRGVDSKEKIDAILDTDINHQHNPMLMKDSEKLVARLKEAVERGRHIVIYGDYDSDGACATAIAVLCLRELGAKVDYWINNRFVHGYGMTPLGVEDLVVKFPDVEVILTVDNGIVAFEGVQAALDRGIEVLITDHHEPKPDGTLPPASAIVDPKRLDETYPFNGICGAAVIYKMMLLLYIEMEQSLDYPSSMIDIVGMATVGDVMPLVDENRLFVKESIKQINRNPRYAFQALKEAIGKSSIDEGTFGFQFVPMVNAVGRLHGVIDDAVEMFLATDTDRVDELVQKLVQTNELRKEQTAEQEALAIELVEKKGVQSVIVLAHEDFHEGIVGLVAGRIKELYHRPTIVMTKHNGLWKGSGRSIDGFSLIQTLHKVADTTHQFGGHDAACGLKVEDHQLQAFEQAIIAEADAVLTDDILTPKVQVDVFLEPHEVTAQLVEELEALKPFGTAFVAPNIAVKDFTVQKTFCMGKEKNHIKLIHPALSLIMWNGAKYYEEELQNAPVVQAIGTPEVNYWNGTVSMQMVVNGDNLRAYSK